MARDLFTAQTLEHELQPSYTEINASNDGKVAWDAKIFLHARNDGGSPATLTVRTNFTADTDLALPDREIVIPAGEYVFSREFAKGYYRQTDGMIYFDVAAADVFIAWLKPAV